MEDDCNDPLAEKKDISIPLDLTVEAGRQPGQPDVATNDPNSHVGSEDDSHLPTKAYLKAEIKKVKELVIKDLMVFNERKEWMCRKCGIVLGSPL